MIDAATFSIVDDGLLASPPAPRILRGITALFGCSPRQMRRREVRVPNTIQPPSSRIRPVPAQMTAARQRLVTRSQTPSGKRKSLRTAVNAVAIPSNQPITAVARMIQTSDARVAPKAQLTFTVRVFAEINTMRTAISPTNAKALV